MCVKLSRALQKPCRVGCLVTTCECIFFSQEDTGDEASEQPASEADRKALRKAKNRASAAASRARREAYTASLEEKASSCLKPHGKDVLSPLDPLQKLVLPSQLQSRWECPWSL